MPARDVHHWIDRWVQTGLLDASSGQLLHDDATRAGAAPEVVEPSVERVLAAARSGVVEALGYVGAALTAGAGVVLFDVGEWPAPGLAALLAVTAVLGGAGTRLLTPAVSPAARRLAGVCGAIAVAATAGAVLQVVGPDRVGIEAPGRELVVAVPALLVGVAVYVRQPHVLTHAALGTATVATCVGLGSLLGGTTSAPDGRDVAVGIVLLMAAVGWVVASERGWLWPAWLGTPVAGAVAYVAVAIATTPVATGAVDLTAVADLALAAIATTAGVVTSRLRVTVVGAVGLLVTVPMFFVQVLGWSGPATAAVLLPVGVAITSWAVVAGRSGTRAAAGREP
jgi:hypothetical protein